MEAEEDKDIQEDEDGDNRGRVSGGGRGWQVREILDIGALANVAVARACVLHSAQTEGGKEGV